jgi:hypothetical protein
MSVSTSKSLPSAGPCCLPRTLRRCAGRSRRIRCESQHRPRFAVVLNAHDEARVGTRDPRRCPRAAAPRSRFRRGWSSPLDRRTCRTTRIDGGEIQRQATSVSLRDPETVAYWAQYIASLPQDDATPDEVNAIELGRRDVERGAFATAEELAAVLAADQGVLSRMPSSTVFRLGMLSRLSGPVVGRTGARSRRSLPARRRSRARGRWPLHPGVERGRLAGSLDPHRD